MDRRKFVQAASAGALLAGPAAGAKSRPAVLGGVPVRTEKFPAWPMFDQKEERALVGTLKSARWGRQNGDQVPGFEREYSEFTGAQGCLATTSGTTALLTALAALDIGAGDEVLVPPYTFVATINVVLLRNALPVFVDTDPETFLMDPKKLEAAITDRTRAILPVHIGGSPCDMDGIMAVAQKHKLAVIEDACQAWVAQWKGRNVGLEGDCGSAFNRARTLRPVKVAR